jgi:lipopolysaccharide export system permease protein
MRLIERYLFRQLLWPTLATTLALGAVALLSQTLSEIDVLVNQHQPIGVFLKLVGLSLPQMIAMVLPISLFVATLMSLNRLHTEQEIVVCFAGGMSRWRVISPAVRLAVMCALVSLVINLWISPWCYRATREELFKIKTDLVSSLVRDGQFNQPSPGLTVYAQYTDRTGLLHNVFIDEEKQPAPPPGATGGPAPAKPAKPAVGTLGKPGQGGATFSAKYGRIVKRDGQPALILNQGSEQQFNNDGVLTFTTYTEYVLDLTPYINSDEDVHFKNSDRYLHELLFPDLTVEIDKHDRKKFLAEAHARLSTPLYNIALMALAIAGVIGGSFSRTGYGRRIMIVSGSAVVIRILGFGAQAACDAAPALNILQYAIPLVPTWIAFNHLFRQKVTHVIPLATDGMVSGGVGGGTGGGGRRGGGKADRLRPLGAV